MEVARFSAPHLTRNYFDNFPHQDNFLKCAIISAVNANLQIISALGSNFNDQEKVTPDPLMAKPQNLKMLIAASHPLRQAGPSENPFLLQPSHQNPHRQLPLIRSNHYQQPQFPILSCNIREFILFTGFQFLSRGKPIICMHGYTLISPVILVSATASLDIPAVSHSTSTIPAATLPPSPCTVTIARSSVMSTLLLSSPPRTLKFLGQGDDRILTNIASETE